MKNWNGLDEPDKVSPNEPEPGPVQRDTQAIWELVIEDMKERDRWGRAKYGTPLQANNGRDPLVDAYQEALDLAVYLRQAIEEKRTGATEPAADTSSLLPVGMTDRAIDDFLTNLGRELEGEATFLPSDIPEAPEVALVEVEMLIRPYGAEHGDPPVSVTTTGKFDVKTGVLLEELVFPESRVNGVVVSFGTKSSVFHLDLFNQPRSMSYGSILKVPTSYEAVWLVRPDNNPMAFDRYQVLGVVTECAHGDGRAVGALVIKAADEDVFNDVNLLFKQQALSKPGIGGRTLMLSGVDDFEAQANCFEGMAHE